MYVSDVTIDIDDNGNSYRCFRSTHSDGEQGEEHSFQFVGEEVAVEHGEVDIDGVQNQFHTNQHGEQVAAGKEAIDACKHHKGGNHQVIFHVYHNQTYLLRAIIIPPTIQASNNMLMTSKGSTY